MSLEDTALRNDIKYLFFFFLFLISCSKKHKEYADNVFAYSEFPREKELKGEVIELDTALLRYPFRIRIEEDKAIVMDLHGLDHYGHLFQYPSFQYLSSFGKRGDSPTEMLSMENFRLQDRGVWTLDANKSELTRLDFSSSGDSLLRDETVTLDEDILRPLDFAIYNDTMFIIPDYSGENRLCRVNCNGRLIDKIGVIPTINEKALKNACPALAQAWRSFLDYNPNNGILAAVTQLGEVVEVYNLKDSTHIICIGEHDGQSCLLRSSDPKLYLQRTSRRMVYPYQGEDGKKLPAVQPTDSRPRANYRHRLRLRSALLYVVSAFRRPGNFRN